MDLNEVVKAAIIKALKADSKAIEEGTFRLDGTRVIIDLSGSITKFPAEWHTPTTSVPVTEAIPLALSMMGIQVENFMEKFELALNLAMSMDEKAKAVVAEFNTKQSATAKRFQETLDALPPRRHEGKIVPKDVKIDVVINLGPALVASATVAVPAP
jgi:hypothetical protein